MHKRICSEDPSMKPHVPIEMAVERALKRLPSQATAPADATCYICLDHDSKLVRGCACRGDSAGFVHLECLIEFAERNEEDSMSHRSFGYCINCKQKFTGALALQLVRRWWRRHRNESVESRHLGESCNMLGALLGSNDEDDAEERLIDAVSNSSHFYGGRLELKMASRMAKERPEEALKLLDDVISQAKQRGERRLSFLARHQYMSVLVPLGRYEEILALATECQESVETSCGDSSDAALIEEKHAILHMLAFAYGMLGRFDESKRAFDELLAAGTRIYGSEHNMTRTYFAKRAHLSRTMAEKAQDLVYREDLANGARYLDAVLVESKACDFFDAKDPNVQINCETMTVAANVLEILGRPQESMALGRLCIQSAREREDLDSETNQTCMWNYARTDFDLHGPTKESNVVLAALLSIRTRLYGPDAPQTKETESLFM